VISDELLWPVGTAVSAFVGSLLPLSASLVYIQVSHCDVSGAISFVPRILRISSLVVGCYHHLTSVPRVRYGLSYPSSIVYCLSPSVLCSSRSAYSKGILNWSPLPHTAKCWPFPLPDKKYTVPRIRYYPKYLGCPFRHYLLDEYPLVPSDQLVIE